MASNMAGANGQHDGTYGNHADPNVSNGLSQSGQRAGTSEDDPWMQYWTGASTPQQMQYSAGQAAQAGSVNGMDTQARGYEQGLAQQLQAQSQGRGPSIAGQQLQQATQQNIRSAAGVAASGRSPNMGASQAVQAAGAANQQAAGQSAMARTQEELNAQQQLAGLSGQMQNAYGANAQMQMQNNQFNTGAQNQQNQFNAGLQQNQNQFYNQSMQQQQSQTNDYEQKKDLLRQSGNQDLRNGIVSDRRAKKAITSGGHSIDDFMHKMSKTGKKAVY